jgi:hypothetical protein
MRQEIFIVAFIVVLSIAYIYFENDAIFAAIAIIAAALFFHEKKLATALFGISFMAACLLFYIGQADSAFRLGIASFALLAGDAAGAVALFAMQDREEKGTAAAKPEKAGERKKWAEWKGKRS